MSYPKTEEGSRQDSQGSLKLAKVSNLFSIPDLGSFSIAIYFLSKSYARLLAFQVLLHELLTNTQQVCHEL